MAGVISLKQGIEEYRDIYLAYRNFARRTREEYVNDLEDLAKYLGKLGIDNVAEVRLPHMVRYMAELDKQGYAGSTRKRKVMSIRSFFSYMSMEGHIVHNVASQLIPPFVEAHKPRYLTSEEIDRLLKAARSNKRDYAIIQTLLSTGVKLSELVGLSLKDLQSTDTTDSTKKQIDYLRVVGSRKNKERVIPVNSEAGKALTEYLATRDLPTSDDLFINRVGEKLGKRGVEKVVEKYFKEAEIKNASVNSIRNTFSINQATKGTDRKMIHFLMGYKDGSDIRKFIL